MIFLLDVSSHKKSVSGLSPETDFFIAYFFLIKYQFFLLPKRFFTKTTIATIAARRIITNGRIGVLSPVLTAVLAVEFDEPDVKFYAKISYLSKLCAILCAIYIIIQCIYENFTKLHTFPLFQCQNQQ